MTGTTVVVELPPVGWATVVVRTVVGAGAPGVVAAEVAATAEDETPVAEA